MLRGKKRKKEQICEVKEVDEEDLYTLKSNCKGKKAVGKANNHHQITTVIFNFLIYILKSKLS